MKHLKEDEKSCVKRLKDMEIKERKIISLKLKTSHTIFGNEH